MNSVAFFGASVTQQKTGYAVELTKLLNIKTSIFGYGGMHIIDAGVCHLNKVVSVAPEYCFIDFFSTNYISTDDMTIEALNTIVYTLTNIKCKLIFLFLPRTDHQIRINFYNFCKDYLKKNKLYFIDLNDRLIANSDLLRDSTHTTDIGSVEYARVIYEILQTDLNKITYPFSITRTKLCDIKCKPINKTFGKSVVLIGDCTVIAIGSRIGLNSGLVEINNKKISIWDKHCHYSRDTFVLNNISVNGSVRINILQEDPDYSISSKCTERNLTKEFNIQTVFYIGNSIDVDGL